MNRHLRAIQPARRNNRVRDSYEIAAQFVGNAGWFKPWSALTMRAHAKRCRRALFPTRLPLLPRFCIGRNHELRVGRVHTWRASLSLMRKIRWSGQRESPKIASMIDR
jgi:hypothetical protein